MARVAHWAQDASLRHFATGIEVQNSMSPGGDVLVLHNYVLTQGDWSANAVQWAAMVFTVLAAWILTRQLGGGETAGWIAAAYVASLPMGIAEASNTMMDYVTAFWVAAAVCETTGLFVREETASWKTNVAHASLSPATLLTKGSGIDLALPGLGCVFLQEGPDPEAVTWGMVGIGLYHPERRYITRNLVTFEEPFGPYLVASQRNELLTPLGLASIALRNASLHAGTPWRGLNELIFRGVAAFHSRLG
jgi:hypothetical protein